MKKMNLKDIETMKIVTILNNQVKLIKGGTEIPILTTSDAGDG